MVLPASNIIIQDPGLGTASAASLTPVVIGVSSSGTANVPQFFSSPGKLVDAFGYGPGVEDALQIMAYAGGPVGFCRVTGSVSAANSAVVKSGAGPTVTIAGSATFDFGAQLKIVKAGALGVGTFQYSIDVNAFPSTEWTFSPELTIPAGGTYLIPGTGITVTFPVGTYVAAETYGFTSECAGFASGDLTTALAAVNGLQQAWRFVHVALSSKCGAASTVAGIVAALQSYLSTQEAAEKYRAAIIGAQGDGGAASAAITAYAAVVANRCVVSSGNVRLVAQYPLQGRSAIDRPGAVCLSARAAGSLISTDLKRVPGNGLNDGGPLPGVLRLYYDERVDAGGVDSAKLSSLRTYQGRPGFYVSQGLIKSASGSDFTIWPRRIVIDVAAETVHAVTSGFIGRGVRSNPGGTIDERDALALETEVNSALASALINPRNAEGTGGHASAAVYTVDRSINIVSTETLEGDVAVRPLGYLTFITTRVGYRLGTAEPATEEI